MPTKVISSMQLSVDIQLKESTFKVKGLPLMKIVIPLEYKRFWLNARM